MPLPDEKEVRFALRKAKDIVVKIDVVAEELPDAEAWRMRRSVRSMAVNLAQALACLTDEKPMPPEEPQV